MTTQEAFNELISQRAWYKPLGIGKAAAASIAKRFRDGDQFSQEKIEQILAKAGYKVEMEKQWSNVTSEIEFLWQVPDYCYGQQEWLDLHAHMLTGMTFVDKMKALDIYLQKKATLEKKYKKSIVETLLEKGPVIDAELEALADPEYK